jgi:hypothetical protein
MNPDEELLARIERVKAKYANGPVEPTLPTFSLVPINLSEPLSTSPALGGLQQILNSASNPKELRQAKREILNRLENKIKFRIPRDIQIDKDVIKQVAQIPRSKIESGQDRANFIIECRKWEKANESGEDQFYWTDKALDVLSSWVGVAHENKDSAEIQQLYEMCQILFQDVHIPSDSKLDIASAFYIAGIVDKCFELYNIILTCPFTRLHDRAECCKFLYHSQNHKFRNIIEKNITEIIETDVDDDTRYETIACFVTDTGVSSKYLSSNLQVGEVDQILLSNLFLKFIKTNPDPYYLVMSAEFLLEQTAFGVPLYCDSCKPCDPLDKSCNSLGKHCDDIKVLSTEPSTNCECENLAVWGYADIKPQVCQILLDIASNIQMDERTRADAADVLINHPIEPYITQARQIIDDIGQAGQTELEKTIYSNKENVHKLNDTFANYTVKMHKKLLGSFPHIDNICVQIEDLIAKSSVSDDDIFKIRKSIDRIMLETTLHTERKISTCEIFRLVWTIVNGHVSKDELVNRIIEELIDMGNTCSTGHAKRLINVMVGFDDQLEGIIDITDQLEANIKARIMATIRHLPDQQKDALLEAQIGNDEEKKPYINHINSVLPDIIKELSREFVDEGWISENKFKKIVGSTVKKLVM